MDFKASYTSEAKKTEPGEDKKVVLSNDSYALCEMFEKLIKNIERKEF